MHGIKVLMAKNYIDNLSEEAGKGLQEKAEQGFWPKKTPLGYNVPFLNTYRTMCAAPESDFRRLLEEVAGLTSHGDAEQSLR
jgi:hypothetical protein